MAFLKSSSPSPLPDQELVSAYREGGDLAILGELYSRYMDLVYGVCLKYFTDTERARDAVMQIFEELVEKLRKHEISHFRAWLFQVSRNHCLMHLRSPHNLKTIEIPASLVQSEENLHLNGVFEKEENLERMEACMGTLPQEQQLSIKLFYLQKKSYHQICEITGMEWNQVRSHIQNGRRNLKTCMEEKLKNRVNQ